MFYFLFTYIHDVILNLLYIVTTLNRTIDCESRFTINNSPKNKENKLGEFTTLCLHIRKLSFSLC